MRRRIGFIFLLGLVVACRRLPLAEPDPMPLDDDLALVSLPLVPMEAAAVPEAEPLYCDTEHPPEIPKPDRRLYATWQTFPLHHEEHGVDGTLRVLQDSRFTVPGEGVRIGTHPILKPCDPLPGRLEVLDAEGRPVDAYKDGPMLDVIAYAFAPHQIVYELIERVRCLTSCWCGDVVKFLRVVGGRIVPLSTQRASGKVSPVLSVTRGCYEGGGVEKGPDGRLEVTIHRNYLFTVETEERHFWDGELWRGSVVEHRAH
jgi:hypothetical protein